MKAKFSLYNFGWNVALIAAPFVLAIVAHPIVGFGLMAFGYGIAVASFFPVWTFVPREKSK